MPISCIAFGNKVLLLLIKKVWLSVLLFLHWQNHVSKKQLMVSALPKYLILVEFGTCKVRKETISQFVHLPIIIVMSQFNLFFT